MVIAVAKDGTDILSAKDITYAYVNGYIYDIPFIVELGAIEHRIDAEKLIIGEAYTIVTAYGKTIELTLSEINPHPNTITNQIDTAYIFMHKESYNLKYNLYKPEDNVWGISLKKYIIGGKNQLQIAIFELRKKGLILAIDENFKIIQRHSKEYEGDDDKYIAEPEIEKKIHSMRSRKNYASIEGDGTKANTKRGSGRPYYIPAISKNEINGLNTLLDPKYIIQATHENITINIGAGIIHKETKYCVMEKNTIYIKSKVKTVITLGEIPDEH